MMTSFLDWSEKFPLGLGIMVLFLQGTIIVPAVSLLSLEIGAGIMPLAISVCATMALLVMTLSLQPPRLIARLFVYNIGLHAVMGGILTFMLLR